jgi:hypothetical protein
MRQARGELSTNVIDWTGVPLAEIRTIDDAAVRRSTDIMVGYLECSRTGVLQNEITTD